MQETKREIHLFRLTDYFQHHPGLLVSVLYFLMTFAGIAFTWKYYQAFDIPFLQLADLSDFLLAGIREPMAIVMILGAIAVSLSADFLFAYSHGAKQRWRAKPPGVLRTLVLSLLWTPRTAMGTYVMIFICYLLPYTFFFITIYAGWKGNYVHDGNGTYVDLVLNEDTGMNRRQILLGSSLNYIFIYEPGLERAQVIPVENVLSITPVARP